MGVFGKVAVRAVEIIQSGSVQDPKEAWEMGAMEFPRSESTRNKGCPKYSFLGLCEEGMVKGVPPGTYTRSKKNKQYAVSAIRLLAKSESLPTKADLWTKISDTTHQGQLDVVYELWQQDLIVDRAISHEEIDKSAL
ncbi:MAG: hypothetical protein BWY45_02966 [Euryarchaeota archaeon ADurb.Bin294]|nr:MAG: hypothetical protein BWY45_02966 [Euryarchaeota archaeon ADurb.Bin294]HOB43697.1 hypothetical protein [Bacillota bacterium]